MMSSDPKSSPAPNPTRRRILAATCELMTAGSQVRMSDIAKAAGISRQALYLHFPNRAELLIAATRHLDDLSDVDAMLAESRAATSGRARLRAFVRAWAGYIPVIYGPARALMAMQDSDAEAAAAWADRMKAMRQGCAAAVADLASDGDLRADMSQTEATDLLWTLLSVRGWEHLVRDCGWEQDAYVTRITDLAERALAKVP